MTDPISPRLPPYLNPARKHTYSMNTSQKESPKAILIVGFRPNPKRKFDDPRAQHRCDGRFPQVLQIVLAVCRQWKRVASKIPGVVTWHLHEIPLLWRLKGLGSRKVYEKIHQSLTETVALKGFRVESLTLNHKIPQGDCTVVWEIKHLAPRHFTKSINWRFSASDSSLGKHLSLDSSLTWCLRAYIEFLRGCLEGTMGSIRMFGLWVDCLRCCNCGVH